jgi:environmental stress-induced protein Ves
MTTPRMTPLPQQDFRRTPWKNGGGVTIDIAGAYGTGAEDGSWAGTIWRFGRTAITVPAPFSDLTGYERMQLVIEGSGLVLEAPDGEIDLRVALRPVRYDGGIPLVSRLETGPVEVINLIAERALCEIDLAVPGADGAHKLTAGAHVLYAPRNSVSGSNGGVSFKIAAGDALRFDATADFVLEVYEGLAVLASIRPK